MHSLVSYNGQILTATDAKLGVLSAAALYGKGIFTTVSLRGTQDRDWLEHWGRLSRDAKTIGMDLSPFELSGTADAMNDLISRNGAKAGRARVTFFDAGSTELWNTAGLAGGTNLLITTADLRPVPKPFKLGISPYRINSASPLAGVKSCNYLEKIIARDEARSRGFDECIQLNERGEIVSAAMANVFWVKDGALFTPSLKTGCVPGITRLMRMEGKLCSELEVGIEELESADDIFLTSAGLGVAHVAEFNGRALKGEDIHQMIPNHVRS